ncbi:MAG: PorT family protein [Bacteroidales bacterium]|nr:PorT family protein [Bacteroidales bacterium]
MKYSIILILIFLFSKSEAQRDFSGGFLLGISASQIDGDNQYKYKKPGLILGAYVSRALTKHGSLKIESYYIGKGAVLNEDYPDGTTIQVFNTSLHYVEMPFLFNLQVHPKIDIAIGVAPSYLFAAKLTTYKASVDKTAYSLKQFDFQPIGEADFYLTDKISTSLRYSYSMFNIRKDPMAVWYNNNLSLVFRYKIK